MDEVGGKILETNNRNTTMESRTENYLLQLQYTLFAPEMVRVIFSPESVGRKKTAIERKAINTVGIIRTTV